MRADRVGVRSDQVDLYGRINPNASFIDDLIQDLPLWTDMPVWKGGTEQVLPENDDEPTSSSILADIQYPDLLRTDQQFTYRETPSTVDGMAKIRKIKGNTVKFNQLVKNGNFADTSNWQRESSVIFTVAGNIATISTSVSGNRYIRNTYNGVLGHKYYYTCDYYITDPNSASQINIYYGNGDQRIGLVDYTVNTWGKFSGIMTAIAPANQFEIRLQCRTVGYENQYTNMMIFDLTDMGMESYTAEQFEAWLAVNYPLSYYAYNAGTLLPFIGESIKTTGKNLFDKANFNGEGTYGSATYMIIPVLFGTYTVSTNAPTGNVWAGSRLEEFPRVYENNSITISNTNVIYIGFATSDLQTALSYNTMIEKSSTATSYEPYTSNTTDLPTLTFYPTGMKAIKATNVYDELLPDKAITRVGRIVIDGTQEAIDTTFDSSRCRAFYNVPDLLNVEHLPDVIDTGIIADILPCMDNNSTFEGKEGVFRRIGGQAQICVSLGIASGITSLADWNAYLAVHPVTIYYPLAVEDVQPTMSFT